MGLLQGIKPAGFPLIGLGGKIGKGGKLNPGTGMGKGKGGGSGGGGGAGPADPFYANVALLLHFDGANGGTTFTDNGPAAQTLTPAGNAQTSTTSPKFGTAKGLFDGTGDQLTTASNAVNAFGTGDFTIECWINFTDANAGVIVSHPFGGGWMLTIVADVMYWQSQYNSVNLIARSCSALKGTGWHYVALKRASSVCSLWFDGVQQGATANDGGVNYTSTTTYIASGVPSASPAYFTGSMDDLRITKGVARDVSTIPLAPFPNF